MIIKKEGDKRKGLCYFCEKKVDATYKIRDIKFNDMEGIVKDILVLVCNDCNKIIATPFQSTAAIREVIDKINNEKTSI